ncbi:MAG: BamA/TamA family outer membrane protein [Phycisphaeraceae bacterium]|nr:BamA/TamA family outer membrane protein [Phycisphaeraceae bacterium]
MTVKLPDFKPYRSRRLIDMPSLLSSHPAVPAYRRSITGYVLFTLWVMVLVTFAPSVMAQGVDVRDRPVDDIRIEGLKQVPETLVRNQIRVAKGDPYDPDVVNEDIIRITSLGRFNSVQARVEAQPDGTVILTYVLGEQALLSDVQVVGNKKKKDGELLALVLLRAGDPIDPFLIDRGATEIRRAYEKSGYFVTDVTVDQEALNESGILLYRIREGPKPKIRGIRFENNTAFSDGQLQSKIKSNTYVFIFRKGELSREQLDSDAARVRDFYHERGYLDAQVGRRIDLAPDQRSAVVVFFVQEGQRYTVSSIKVAGNNIFTSEQILETMALKQGDIFSADLLTKTEESLGELYGKLGFIEARVEVKRLFHETEPKVDVIVNLDEGVPYTVGKMSVSGNDLTKDKVILRQVRGMKPGRRFDGTGIKITEQRLTESSLFSKGTVTVLGQPVRTPKATTSPEETSKILTDEAMINRIGQPVGSPERDVLVTVEEKNTGSLSFGAGISSDSGVLGAIDLVQRNFDIADFPDSPGEFFSGKAFRGAGQYFGISLQPGNETSRYSVNFREPYLLDSSLFLDTSLFFFTRSRSQYDEERFGGAVGLGQRFGDVWSASIRARGEHVNIENIETDAPVDVFAVEGKNLITSLGFYVARNTTDNAIFPTRGSKWEAGISRTGALGGDFDFTGITTEFRKFWTVDEDFFGRRTVFSSRTEIGYILEDADEVPVFERFYAGGHRSLRGFDFRGVSPRGIRNDTLTLGDDPIGGEFLFIQSFEYNFPVYEDVIRAVFFTDTGTVDTDFNFSKYRVSIGTGIRIKIPFLGQAPFALDVAYPLIKEKEDDIQYFSFDLAVPF